MAGGLLAGQSLFGIWHGTDLTIAWAAPADSSSQLTTVGAWASGGSLIRVRVDEAVSYDATTGARQWALQLPGVDVACGVSGTSSTNAIGLIAYGQDSTTCDHLMAVDLATGRQLWSDKVRNPFVDESDPAYSLEEVGVATGTLRSLGYYSQGILQTDQSGLYAFGADYLVVNTIGAGFGRPPVAAIKAQPARS